MRALLAASIGSLCTAALLVPTATPAVALVPTAADTPATADRAPAAPADLRDRTPAAPAATRVFDAGASDAATRSVPLAAFPAAGAGSGTEGAGSDGAWAGAPDGPRAFAGLDARRVAPFSLLGVVWDDAEERLPARVEVRTRAAGTAHWSRWTALDHHAQDAPDADSAERTEGRLRGSTAPMWVGASNGVEVRLLPESGATDRARTLPTGLRVVLVDPGTAADDRGEDAEDTGVVTQLTPAADDGKSGGPAPELSPAAAASSAVNAQLAGMGADLIPALGREETQAGVLAAQNRPAGGDAAAPIGPRPGIVTRKGWGANESWRERDFVYTTTVKSAFVHHTAQSNNYTCAQAPSVIRGIYQYHVQSLGWRDIGYNFLVDKCGTIYEGRAGGVANAVLGAHTYGFNSNTTGIAVLGSYGSVAPSKDAVEGVSKLIAWKLGLHGLNPVGSVTLTSGGGKYPAGTQVTMRAVAGHRDGFATECPGAQLYGRLGEIRTLAAKLQGR